MPAGPTAFVASAAKVPVARAIALMEGIGRPGFGATLLEAANRYARVDHCSLMHIHRRGEVQVYAAESVIARPGTAGAAVAYIDRYHRFDPNRRLLREAGRLRGSVLIRHLVRDDVGERRYREACYERPGLSDRLSLITADDDQSLVVVNFYRLTVSGTFAPRDVKRLSAASALFASAALRHIDLVLHTAPDPKRWRERLLTFCPHLTGREVDAAACMLAGLTLREGARSFGIARSSMITYRARAYARLGVSNFRELRALFSSH